MGYASNLRPRAETISNEGIEGIIDLANLQSGNKDKIETNPDVFFNLTYPTSDIVKVIDNIHTRFSSEKGASGLFLFEGLKGSGKSHLHLLIYNLFVYPDIAQKWLKQHNMKCVVPTDVTVVINKFTDNPYDCIWDLVFTSLGNKIEKGNTHPNFSDFQKALGDKKLILIFDELEMGIKVIANEALQKQNIAFLQMLSEFSNRSKQVTMFASIYSENVEPGSTLKRVPRCTVQFDNSKDKCNVVMHRLFENYLSFDRKVVSPAIESIVSLWNRHVSFDAEDMKTLFRDSYPFSPSLIDITLTKIPSKGGFQNVRGALFFLSNLVNLTYKSNDIITPADVYISDKPTVIILKDIDVGGNIVDRAKENLEELKKQNIPLAEKLASAVLLYTITTTGKDKGVSRESITIDMLSPSVDINDIIRTIAIFQKYASYFHTEGERFFFDVEEQPEAKVEYKSLNYSDDEARQLIIKTIKEDIFKETASAVVFLSVEQTQQALNQSDKARLRFVLTARRLTQEERHHIYFGMDYRNLIILLEPKDSNFQLLTDKDILKWAKRALSAKTLASGVKKAQKQSDYEKIARTDLGNIVDRIKKAGLTFVCWSHYGATVSEDRVELEPLQGDCSKDKVMDSLSQEHFPMLTIKEHLESRKEYIMERLVKELHTEYQSTLGFPIPIHLKTFASALRDLCKDRVIGIQHSSGSYCGRNPELTETQLFESKIIPPFSEQLKPKTLTPEALEEKKLHTESIDIDKEQKRISCSTCNQEPCTCAKKEKLQLKIPFQYSILKLKEETAFKLQQYENVEIISITFKIFYDQRNIGDLSVISPTLRGKLSGAADMTAEITIAKSGRFSKSEIEQFVEALPTFPGGEYTLDMTVEVTKSE
ncbi:ATPase [Candidatus Magnetoovum chiemensis]|nr:ATPase [Candidatus Magnetoovum chiemensis]